MDIGYVLDHFRAIGEIEPRRIGRKRFDGAGDLEAGRLVRDTIDPAAGPVDPTTGLEGGVQGAPTLLGQEGRPPLTRPALIPLDW